MKVKLLFFASMRDIAGCRESEWDVPEGASVSDLKQLLVVRYPGMKNLQHILSVAVNAEYVDGSAVLHAGDEVALIPPVSGG